MARVRGVAPTDVDPGIRDIFDRQVKTWGTVLDPYLAYARRPGICRAVRGMWDALDDSGLIEEPLKALVCRRVASLIGCPF